MNNSGTTYLDVIDTAHLAGGYAHNTRRWDDEQVEGCRPDDGAGPQRSSLKVVTWITRAQDIIHALDAILVITDEADDTLLPIIINNYIEMGNIE